VIEKNERRDSDMSGLRTSYLKRLIFSAT
jgi:hypothetical protein